MKKNLLLICLFTILLLQGCGEKHVAAEPDVVSSISMNRDQILTVVANCDEIENIENLYGSDRDVAAIFLSTGKKNSIQNECVATTASVVK